MVADSIQLYTKEEIERWYSWWRAFYNKKVMVTPKPPFTFSEIQRELLRLENLEAIFEDLICPKRGDNNGFSK